MAVALLVAMSLYLFGAPVACFVLASWWPLLLGAGGLLGVVCILLAITLVRDTRAEARRLPTLAELQHENVGDDIPPPRRGER